MLPRPGHQTSPRSGAHPLHVPPQATPQQGERRSLVDHPVQPPFAVPPEPAARRVRLPIVEPGLPERGRFSTHACSEVWNKIAGWPGTAAARSARVGCRPSRSLYSTYPLPVTHDPSGARAAASRNRATTAAISGAAGWLQSAPDAR